MTSLSRRLRRHVAGDDALRQPLDDRRLPRPRLADEDRVVLGAAREHLDRAADLVDAADDRVELAVARGLREVAPVALERLELRFGVLVGDFRAASQLLDRGGQALGGRTGALERAAGLALVARERHEQVLAGDVGVLKLLGELEGVAEDRVEARADAHLRGGAGDLGGGGKRCLDGSVETGRVRADLREDRPDDALGLVEQRLEQVLGFDLAGLVLLGDSAGCFERFLRLDGELVESHRLLRLRVRTRGPRCSYPPDRAVRFVVQAGAPLRPGTRCDHTQATACQPGPPQISPARTRSIHRTTGPRGSRGSGAAAGDASGVGTGV